MADNVTLDAGAGGDTIAADDDGTAKHQYVKVEFGADDTQTKVTATTGLPVKLLAGTAEVGKLAAGVAEIGNVKNSGTFATQATLQAGTAEVGKLAAGVAEIGNVKNSGTFVVQSTLQTGSAAIGKLAANSGVDIGDVDVTSISAGANLIGDVGLSGARTSGGTTIFRSIDLDEGTLEVVKASAGQLYWIHVINLATAVRFVKIYNATSGTIGTGTPVLTFPIPTQGDSNGAGFTLSIPNGIAFGTGISIGASTGIADADTGAPGTNEVVVNLGFA